MSYLKRVIGLLFAIVMCVAMIVLVTFASMIDRPLAWFALMLGAWLVFGPRR